MKLNSLKTFMISRTEIFGDENHKQYHLGLIDEHDFIVEATTITSYCLKNYDEVKNIDNCNMICGKFSDKYKKSNKEYIDSFKVVKTLLEHKDKLLSDIPFDENIMQTQFYDKVTQYKILEYPKTCISYQAYEPKEKTNIIKFILILKPKHPKYTPHIL